jgi:hypothetical protein
MCVCAPAFRSLSIVMQSCTRVRPGHRSLCDQPVTGARARQAIAALQQLGEGDTAAGGGGGGGVAEACRSGRRDSTAGSPYPQVIYIYMTLPYPQVVAVPLC